MNILVGKNGTQHGPFSLAEVTARLNAGEFSPTDYGWHEGMTAWEPLGQLVARVPADSPAVLTPALGMVSTDPLSAVSAGPAGTFSGYAGFWRRAAALIVDALFIIFVSFVVGFVIGFVLYTVGVRSRETLNLLGNLVGIAINWAYFAGMESSRRQATLGKMAFGIRVTDLNGSRVTLGRATGRHFGKIVSALILGIGFMMAGFTQRKQALHDMMAGCLVVANKPRL